MAKVMTLYIICRPTLRRPLSSTGSLVKGVDHEPLFELAF